MLYLCPIWVLIVKLHGVEIRKLRTNSSPRVRISPLSVNKLFGFGTTSSLTGCSRFHRQQLTPHSVTIYIIVILGVVENALTKGHCLDKETDTLLDTSGYPPQVHNSTVASLPSMENLTIARSKISSRTPQQQNLS